MSDRELTVGELVKQLQANAGDDVQVRFVAPGNDVMEVLSVYVDCDDGDGTVCVALEHDGIPRDSDPEEMIRESILGLVKAGKTQVRAVVKILDQRHPARQIRRELRIMLEDGTLEFDDQLKLKRLGGERRT